MGQEIELEESLSKLQKSAILLEEEIKTLPSVPLELINDFNEKATLNQIQRRITDEATRLPSRALFMLSSELEILARQILAATGFLENQKFLPFSNAIAELHKHFGLPENIKIALDDFRTARNRLVHEGQDTNEEILRAINSGLIIFRALTDIPREVNIVFDPAVEIYSNAELTKPIEGLKGVMLETHSPDRETKSLRIFPTTKTHFMKGKQVAWEWNMQLVVEKAWYRHPISGETTVAWHSSAEFTGRHLDDFLIYARSN
jgi:hypothetical protein